MNDIEAIATRHSVRSYTQETIPADIRRSLDEEIERCNREGGLDIKSIYDEPEAFSSAMAHYGSFRNVRNYLVLAGKPSPDLEERCGYYGERLVLLAQRLGLNSCWVALTYKKRAVRKIIDAGQKLCVVIALGYGETNGKPRKSKMASQVSSVPNHTTAPAWFSAGVDAALLTPTAMNQQNFSLALVDACADRAVVELTSKGGPYSSVDKGIVRLHFEIGARSENGSFTWKH